MIHTETEASVNCVSHHMSEASMNAQQAKEQLKHRYPELNFMPDDDGVILFIQFGFGDIGHLSAEVHLDVESLVSAEEVATRLTLISEAFRDQARYPVHIAIVPTAVF
jgi:hypothetical protein